MPSEWHPIPCTTSGQFKGWTVPAQLGQLKTGQGRKGLLRSDLFLQGYGIEQNNFLTE